MGWKEREQGEIARIGGGVFESQYGYQVYWKLPGTYEVDPSKNSQ